MKKLLAVLIYLTLLLVLLNTFVFQSFAYDINTFSPESPWILDPSGNKVLKVDPAGNANVAIQDQHTDTIILPLVLEIASSTLSAQAIIDSRTITVVSATGFVIGQHLRIINSAADRFYFGAITNIVGTTITLDTPLDFAYLPSSEVTVSTKNMAVDGSVTPVTFVLRTGSPSIPSDVDITRIIIVCTTATAVDLNKFGDLPALTNGIVFRVIDGKTLNIFNVKSNFDLAGLDYDWTPFSASNPVQGIDGFVSRFTIAGQNKVGVTLRIGQFDNINVIIQDDLTGLVDLEMIVEGHVVE